MKTKRKLGATWRASAMAASILVLHSNPPETGGFNSAAGDQR
jgi:hypothetical protein